MTNDVYVIFMLMRIDAVLHIMLGIILSAIALYRNKYDTDVSSNETRTLAKWGVGFCAVGGLMLYFPPLILLEILAIVLAGIFILVRTLMLIFKKPQKKHAQ